LLAAGFTFNLLSSQFLLQHSHILGYFFINHFGVNVGGLQVFMPQHLAHGFNRHPICQGYGSGKGMSCYMTGKVFLDFTDIRNRGQIDIQFLVTPFPYGCRFLPPDMGFFRKFQGGVKNKTA